MIRTLALTGGELVSGGEELLTRGEARWVDVEAQTAAELDLLARTFDLHPLAVEDCLHLGQRPKIERYPGSLFLVLHTFTTDAEDPSELELHEIHFFLTPEMLVTVHADPVPAVEELRTRAREGKLLARGPAAMLHLVVDAVVDAEHPVLNALHEAIDDLEEEALAGLAPRGLERLFRIKRAILRLRRTLAPAREVLLQLQKREDELLGTRDQLYFRDVLDHAMRNAELLEAARERINDTLDAAHSASANTTNQVLKRLAIFSAVFLPLTFVTGFFGMNFEHLPFDDDHLLVAAVASMGILPVAMVLWFRYSRWL